MISKTLLQKPTGNITLITADAGEHLSKKAIPFETFVQLLNGKAVVSLPEKKLELQQGEFVIIPAHKTHHIDAIDFCLMTVTIIKSGYETLSP